MAYEETFHFRHPASPKYSEFDQVTSKVNVFSKVHKNDAKSLPLQSKRSNREQKFPLSSQSNFTSPQLLSSVIFQERESKGQKLTSS